MSLVKLFEVPDFRRKAKFLLEIFEEANSLKIGSSKWIEKMSEEVLLNNFTTLEIPTNLEDFIAIKNFSDFIEDENPISIYIFAYLFKEEVIEYLVHDLVDAINDDNVDLFMMSDQERQKYKDHLPKYDFIKSVDANEYIIKNKERVLIYAKEMSKMELPYNDKLIKFIKLLEKTFFYKFGCSIECEEGDFHIELQFKSGGIISTVFFGNYEDWKYFFNFLEEGEEFKIEESENTHDVEFFDDKLKFAINDNNTAKSTIIQIIFNDINREHILKQFDIIDKECIAQRKHDKTCAKLRERGVHYNDIPKYKSKIKRLI